MRRDAARGVDAIVNFAAETHVDRSIADPEAFLRTDILGTHTLLEVVRERGIGRLVQVSTDEVYGSIDEGSFCETDRISPSSPYSASKAGGDLQVLAYHTTYGTPGADHPRLEHLRALPVSREAHPALRHQRARGREAAALRRRPERARLAPRRRPRRRHRGRARCTASPGEVYNVGGGNERTNRRDHRRSSSTSWAWTGRRHPPGHRPARPRPALLARLRQGCARSWAGDPGSTSRPGLRDTIRWYRDNEWWWKKIKHRTEEFADWSTAGTRSGKPRRWEKAGRLRETRRRETPLLDEGLRRPRDLQRCRVPSGPARQLLAAGSTARRADSLRRRFERRDRGAVGDVRPHRAVRRPRPSRNPANVGLIRNFDTALSLLHRRCDLPERSRRCLVPREDSHSLGCVGTGRRHVALRERCGIGERRSLTSSA